MPILESQVTDWKLDRETWDIVIPLVRISGAEAVAQRINILLRMIRGEWFAAMTKGMPWFSGNGVDEQTAILGQVFAEVKTRAEVRKIILSVDGTDVIERLAVVFNRTTRKVDIAWRCKTVWGDTVADEFDRPLAA